jgi:hypothetical protein
MGTGKKEQGRPAESDHGICISNSRARLGDLPFQNIKITKRTHLSFSVLPANKGDCHVRAAKHNKNEPKFPARPSLCAFAPLR